MYKSNYTIDVPFIINRYIYEYDISKANINILYKYGAISKSVYEELKNSNRNDRVVKIGLMMKDNKELSKLHQSKLKEEMNNFITVNNIEESDIVSIKSDAIFSLKKAKILDLDRILFTNDSIYTLFCKIMNYEFYYYSTVGSAMDILDVKGINDDILPLHSNYMLKYLSYIFYLLQSNNINEAILTTQALYDNYINLRLPLGYYREFNPFGKFVFGVNGRLNIGGYTTNSISKQDLKYINIQYNENFIREVFSLLNKIYL